ncbi:uncharacterized protein B0H18DRAFT_957573 [Fomitopsis serialis]|uniref:uncharacterized protein n=1 Tax=Fomitopsis serialis TaxID=139415 RepID=UPI0020074833|nr:uncharacterized protein B0H18DRAFT_957573 [Neoantrodia serialis]KAH9919302.1 hypothetical protein B0H18DRAFT_957573 [Neoantrodia serialis]
MPVGLVQAVARVVFIIVLLCFPTSRTVNDQDMDCTVAICWRLLVVSVKKSGLLERSLHVLAASDFPSGLTEYRFVHHNSPVGRPQDTTSLTGGDQSYKGAQYGRRLIRSNGRDSERKTPEYAELGNLQALRNPDSVTS